MKKLLKKLALALLSTLIALSFGEVALRLLGHKFTGSTFINDPVAGWSLRAGAGAWEADEGVAWSRINSLGFRDRERSVTKPSGVYRVAVLGDSITEARQVDMEKTFTALAERELNRLGCRAGGQVEVLNFGVGGYGTAQELLLLRDRVWKFSPDLVVLQIYPGNDLFNNVRALNVSPPDMAPYFVLKNGKLELDESFRQGIGFNPTYIRLKGVGAGILNSSRLLGMIYKVRLMLAQRSEVARLEGQPGRPSDPNAPPPNYQQFLAYQPPRIPAMIEAWQVTEALLAEFNNEARTHQAPLLVMIAPTTHQTHYDPNEGEKYRAMFDIESLEYPDERIEQAARAFGMPVLRLTKPLLEEAVRTKTFMAGFANTGPNEGHSNERGHEVIARELARTICEIAKTGVPANPSGK